MRNYQHIDRYLSALEADVYPQPPDAGHQQAIVDVIRKWVEPLAPLGAILDVGCGQGQAFGELQRCSPRVEGVTLGEDAKVCKALELRVYHNDMSFLPFGPESYDLIFARHVLEHSPFPLLTLMEWHRVSKRWLVLIVPSLDHFGPSGRNHYYVLRPDQWANLLTRAGWEVEKQDFLVNLEYRLLCRKADKKK